jgi:site-specific recombinase XerD
VTLLIPTCGVFPAKNILSRYAIQCSKRTIIWYEDTLDRILEWMVERGVSRPTDITVQLIRTFIAEMLGRKLSDSYVHIHARTIRTFMNFLYNKQYIPQPVKLKLPKIEEKRLLCLDAEQVQTLVKACDELDDLTCFGVKICNFHYSPAFWHWNGTCRHCIKASLGVPFW